MVTEWCPRQGRERESEQAGERDGALMFLLRAHSGSLPPFKSYPGTS